MISPHPFRSKDFQLYCNLANQSATIQPIEPQYRMQKRWITASRKPFDYTQKSVNRAVEHRYDIVLTKAMQLLSCTSPCFIRDYRHDNSEDFLSMHAFISESFYWYLECSYSYNYQVEYAFNNCPFEVDLRKLMNSYPLDERTKEVSLKPDFLTFYKQVLTVQDRKYITIT